ncbi:vomeronasal type-2 receptor 26-like [Leptodactylus fuscus]
MIGKSLYATILFLSPISPLLCQKLSSSPRCSIEKRWTVFNAKYVQDGDLIIGGIFTVTCYTQLFSNEPNEFASYCDVYLMALIFAVDEINKNPDILPNTTLGYHVYDSCNNVNKAIDSVLQILSGPGDTVPNYFCAKFGHLVGVIGDMNSDISLNLAQILSIFGYSQISYGAVDPILSTLRLFPSFFQALPNFSTQILAIVHLLRHYNWTWIGVITSDDDVGEKQSQELKAMAAKYEICIEYSIKINDDKETRQKLYEKMRLMNNSTSQIVYLRRIHFRDPHGEDVYFNEKGEMSTTYSILNYASAAKEAMTFREVGHFNASFSEGNQLVLNKEEIIWKYSDIPVSTCSEQCPPGYKIILKPGIHKCCFQCLRCAEGEISNKTDSVSCHECPEDQWPNDMNQCVPKPIDFLSYKNDSAVLTVSIISTLCFFKTSIILGIFILFRDTPVVRANNQTLSFILLASIMLSFLCVFLFLGRPTHVSCMLRQTSFGIIFSVAISSILAKTILVYMAFKATKPGSSWGKFIGVKIPNCVVFFCSFLQVLLSIIWLSTSPPFPEMNTHLYQDKIIFQCNEGSMLAFSILLGYMGLLAAISFMVAFLARNLPDSFNEAKNITFSMLVVCSVWVAFIPAYMSVTGKNTVLVEIFAIISSSVGILGCIFFPKCYIILVRPELNSKCRLSRKIQANPLHYCT